MSKPTVKLIGEDGNALHIVGTCVKVLKKEGFPEDKIKEFKKEALSGNYDHLLQVVMEWFDIE